MNKEQSFVLENGNLKVTFSNVGASIFSIIYKGKELLKHPKKIEDFYYSPCHFGKCCGPYAGRIKNGTYFLNKRTYSLASDGSSVLHGNDASFSFKIFEVENLTDNEITFYYFRKDGEGGFNGNVKVWITYALSERNIKITHSAFSDEDTPFNMTSHIYWNLDTTKGCILNHSLRLSADQVSLLDDENCAIGMEQLSPSFDFSKKTKIGEHINDESVMKNLGYNHIYKMNHQDKMALLFSSNDDIEVCLNSSYKYLTLYTCNYPSTTVMENDKPLDKYEAVCLEFEHFPNGLNSDFLKDKSDILKANVKTINYINITFK